MSSVQWHGDNLIQRVGDSVEELGHVKYDENTGTYVLWLRDLRGVFGTNKRYIRGHSFASMEDARRRAAGSESAQHFHLMWLAGLRDSGQPPPDRQGADWDWAPFVRFLNHVREQLPSWVEQATDWLSNLPGFFRARVAKLPASGA